MGVSIEHKREVWARATARYRAAHPDRVAASRVAQAPKQAGYSRTYRAGHLVERRESDRIRAASDPDGPAKARAIYYADIERTRRISRERYAADIEASRAAGRAWYAAHREQRIAYARAHRTPEPGRKWREDHPDETRAAQLRRRAREAAAPGYASAEAIAGRWEMWRGCCWRCGAVATATDHVKPLAVHGSNWPANLRPVCGSCNSRKWRHWPLTRDEMLPRFP
jgi:5-methylcytosine-specific restriction endonuclease McrA